MPAAAVSFRYDDPSSGLALMKVSASRHVFPKHSHETYYIVGIIDAGMSYCYGPEREESLAGPGDLFVINPGRVHSGVPLRGAEVSYRMLSINADRFAALATEVSDGTPTPPEFPIRFRPDSALTTGLDSTLRLLESGSPFLAAEESLLGLTASLLPFANHNRPLPRPPYTDHPGLLRAEELLSNDLEAALSLEELSTAAGMSQWHLIRSFKRVFGLSPHRYRTQKRVGRAKAMLRSGRAQAEIALTLGFYDQSHFSNAFRSYTGLTPSEYLAGTRARKA